MTGTEAQLRQRMDEWKAAFEAKDVDRVMAFYADDFSAFDLMPPIEFGGGDMWRENWVGFFAAWEGALQLEFARVQVHAAPELGFVRLLVRLVGTMNGRESDLWVRTTNCFRLVDGEWLMVHDHVSVPLDFATGEALLGLSPTRPFG